MSSRMEHGEKSVDSRQMDEWIISRIEGLDRTLRAQRWALVSLGLLLVVAVAGAVFLWSSSAGAPMASDAVHSREFVLVDARGRARGSWSLDADGNSRLMVRDSSGVARIRLSVMESGAPGIAMSDERGRTRAVLGILPDGTSSLAFADRDGDTRVVLGVSPDQTSTLVFASPAGETLAALGVEPGGLPTFILREDEDPSASPSSDSVASGGSQE